jgi:predicted metal-binding membrane protein
MMLPTSLPLVALFGAIVRQRADRTRLMALLLVGYVATWVGFGVVLLAGDAILHAMLASLQWLASGAGLLAAGVLVLAGAYQFTSLKRHCLTQCRSPRSFILGHWRGNASGDALRLGVRHGLYCLGCCWTLMLVMFAVGLGSLAWMVALGAVMGAEKNLAWGRRLSAPLGVVLLGAGAWVGAVELGLTSGVV